ncbi:MAG: hypothetical protein ACREGD_03250 [Candidatus Saccharimonadales bacterium]
MAYATYKLGVGVRKHKSVLPRFATVLFGVLFLMALLVSLTVSAAASTVVVQGNTAAGENQPGWMFNRDPGTATPYEFNTDQASIGAGSLYVQPIGAAAADKFIAENFLLAPMADVDSISYDFMIGSGGTEADKVHFYMNVYTTFGESNPLKFYDCRYNVVPIVGSTGGFTTVTFDPAQAYSVTTRGGAQASPHTCPAVPADMDTLSPGSSIRAFALNVGDTSTNDVGLDGYLDKVAVNTVDQMIYDFEPTLKPSSKEACKRSGWTAFNAPAFKNQGQCVSWVNQQ